MQSKYYNSNMRNNIISALVVTLISFFIAVLMENISVFVFAILSWMIVICIDNFLFKNYEKHVNTLLLIWIIYMGGILWIYYAEKHVYGAPYMMSDDYRMETEWVKECLEKKCYTIRQMVRRSSFFNVANCNAHILFLAYLNRIAAIFGGYHTFDGRITNATASIICGILISKICRENIEKGNAKATKNILFLSSLLPNIVYLSAHIFRDCYLMLLLVLLFYVWNDVKLRRKPIFLLIFTAVDIYLLYWNRAFSVIYGLAIIYLEFFFVDFQKKIIDKKYRRIQLIGLVWAAGFLFFFVVWILQLSTFSRYITLYTTINTESGGLSGFIYGVKLFPFGWLLRIAFYLCSPFYPQFVGIKVYGIFLDAFFALITFGTCFFFFLYPYLFKGIVRLNALSMIFLIIFCSSAIITSGFRHILMSYPFMFIISAYEYYNTNHYERSKYTVYAFSFFAVYMVLYIFSRFVL